MHTCSRIQPKSSSIRTVVAAMTTKAMGCSAGERVTQRPSALTPTK
jgi:hypothetical protein